MWQLHVAPSSLCENHCRHRPLRSPENQKIRQAACALAAVLFPLFLPREQPAASGQQPPNCWGEGVFPYLIALDDVIDLPQVVAATCFVADLQQHQAYFLLSQFSHSDSTLIFLLKYTEKKKKKNREKAVVKVTMGHKKITAR